MTWTKVTSPGMYVTRAYQTSNRSTRFQSLACVTRLVQLIPSLHPVSSPSLACALHTLSQTGWDDASTSISTIRGAATPRPIPRPNTLPHHRPLVRASPLAPTDSGARQGQGKVTTDPSDLELQLEFIGERRARLFGSREAEWQCGDMAVRPRRRGGQLGARQSFTADSDPPVDFADGTRHSRSVTFPRKDIRRAEARRLAALYCRVRVDRAGREVSAHWPHTGASIVHHMTALQGA